MFRNPGFQPRFLSIVGLLFALSACSPPPAPRDAGRDADQDVAHDVVPDTGRCATDQDCADGVFCNGAERCMPGAPGANARGCLAPSSAMPCLASQTCNESMARCETQCDIVPDADHDGHRAVLCGGDDCDDTDANRFPGNVEVCDTSAHDEDCDATTVGVRDVDRDGFTDSTCCNVAADGTRACGEDCNDARRNVSPTASEVCDHIDNDCNGQIDEGVTMDGFVDADHDLHGDPTRPLTACAFAPGFSPLGDDCDDTNAAANPTQHEICDGIDNDCDGMIDEDPRPATWYRDTDGDQFGSAASGTVVSCTPVAGYVLLSTDCDDTRHDTSPAANEICDGRDNDCNGVADYIVAPGDFEDDDGDGAPDMHCPLVGNDCDDRDANTRPGRPEVCDGRDNNCNGMIDETSAASPWYADADSDGYGDMSMTPTASCAPIAGRVTRGGDCDDAHADVHPDLSDPCNGVDDDCDGMIDEDAVFTAWYTDADGDGFGGGTAVIACAAPAGLIAEPGDCSDTNASAHPGVAEVCNGIDDDCDGTVDGPAATAACTAVPNATSVCTAGACVIGTCAANFADCNGVVGDGCEQPTAVDPNHCGSCTNVCSGVQACIAGACIAAAFPSTGAEGPFAPASNTAISAGVHNYTTVDIPAGVIVRVLGNAQVAILATGSIRIAGTLDLSGGPGVATGAQLTNGGG